VYGLTLQDPSSQRWHEVPDAIAREKVGQQIRENLAKINPMKSEARKVQRKSKAKRPRQTLSTSTSMMPSSSIVSMTSSATQLSSVGEEFNCGNVDWGKKGAIDTDDTTPLQVDLSTSTSISKAPISISPPPSPPPLPQNESGSAFAFMQSSTHLHKNTYVCQSVPNWQNQQELVWNYSEV
jgi:hypothetical protein